MARLVTQMGILEANGWAVKVTLSCRACGLTWTQQTLLCSNIVEQREKRLQNIPLVDIVLAINGPVSHNFKNFNTFKFKKIKIFYLNFL